MFQVFTPDILWTSYNLHKNNSDLLSIFILFYVFLCFLHSQWENKLLGISNLNIVPTFIINSISTFIFSLLDNYVKGFRYWKGNNKKGHCSMESFKGKFHSRHDFDWSLVWNSCFCSLRFSCWPHTLCSSGLHPDSLIWSLAFLCSFAILDFTQKIKLEKFQRSTPPTGLWLVPLCGLIHNFLYCAFFFIRKKKFLVHNSWHVECWSETCESSENVHHSSLVWALW